jgi:hypothetical protein
MAANLPDRKARRVAVILGAGGLSRNLLDLVLPLLVRDRGIEMHGVFLEEAEIQHAAELPFVQELCRVTFSVREFTSDQFERTLNLRMRSAQRALSVLAKRTGVLHSFRNVRGPAIRLLLETASASDITVFEPARWIGQPVPRRLHGRAARHRIVVAVSDFESGRRAMLAAGHLAEGEAGRITILATGAAGVDVKGLGQLCEQGLSGRPARLRVVPAKRGIEALVDAARAEAPALFVIAATDELLTPENLQLLRERLRCPICLVRNWRQEEPEKPQE